MSEIRYIHAADLHLDAPFAGLTKESSNPNLAKIIQESTFTALERLVRLCESQKPHFLVLAGDIYNGEEASIKAQLKLRDACMRLDDLGISVYIAHGNHDPLSSKFQSLRFPANTHIFPTEKPESLEFIGVDNTRAIVHGISHGQDREARNLSLLFQRKADNPAFQLGVLHCSVENSASGDRYAPCTLNDLKQSGMDAWALGHVHQGGVLSDTPFIAYSGNTQGLHINEAGQRGCYLVRAIEHRGIWHCEPEFHSLAQVQWRKLNLNMDQVSDRTELESRLAQLIEDELDLADPNAAVLIIRLIINGHTNLNSWLRQTDRMEELRQIIAQHSGSRPMLWLKDVELNTQDEQNWQDIIAREDLVGESMRIYAELLKEPEEFKKTFEQTLSPLFKKGPVLEKIFKETDETELKNMLYQAESICMDVLEKG